MLSATVFVPLAGAVVIAVLLKGPRFIRGFALAVAVADPPGDDAAVARPHGAKVDEAEVPFVEAARHPTEHPAEVTVDPVPHDLTDKSADLPETRHLVKLGHPDGHFVAAALTFASG